MRGRCSLVHANLRSIARRAAFCCSDSNGKTVNSGGVQKEYVLHPRVDLRVHNMDFQRHASTWNVLPDARALEVRLRWLRRLTRRKPSHKRAFLHLAHSLLLDCLIQAQQSCPRCPDSSLGEGWQSGGCDGTAMTRLTTGDLKLHLLARDTWTDASDLLRAGSY